MALDEVIVGCRLKSNNSKKVEDKMLNKYKMRRNKTGQIKTHKRPIEWRFQCTCKISICKEFDMIYAGQCKNKYNYKKPSNLFYSDICKNTK